MMIDFVDHVVRYYAAVVIPTQAMRRLEGSNNGEGTRALSGYVRNDLSIISSPDFKFIESYSGLYAKVGPSV